MTLQQELSAAELLVRLRAAGCIVSTNGDRLSVEGPEDAQALWDDSVEALSQHKQELIRILMAERAAAEPPPPPPEPPIILPPLPLGPVHAGVAVMTPELFAWRGRRDAAMCQGRRFDEPPPRYYYPQFEPDPRRRAAMYVAAAEYAQLKAGKLSP